MTKGWRTGLLMVVLLVALRVPMTWAGAAEVTLGEPVALDVPWGPEMLLTDGPVPLMDGGWYLTWTVNGADGTARQWLGLLEGDGTLRWQLCYATIPPGVDTVTVLPYLSAEGVVVGVYDGPSRQSGQYTVYDLRGKRLYRTPERLIPDEDKDTVLNLGRWQLREWPWHERDGLTGEMQAARLDGGAVTTLRGLDCCLTTCVGDALAVLTRDADGTTLCRLIGPEGTVQTVQAPFALDERDRDILVAAAQDGAGRLCVLYNHFGRCTCWALTPGQAAFEARWTVGADADLFPTDALGVGEDAFLLLDGAGQMYLLTPSGMAPVTISAGQPLRLVPPTDPGEAPRLLVQDDRGLTLWQVSSVLP